MNIPLAQNRISKFFILTLIGLLVAVFGASLSTLSATVSAATEREKNSYLLLFSQQGKYNRAAIYVNNPADKEKCGGKSITGTKPTTVKLSSKKTKSGQVLATKVKCSPGSYNVFFMKKGDKLDTNSALNTTSYAAAGLTEGYCAFVHIKGVNRNEAVDAKNKCAGDDDPNADTVDKVTPVMTVVQNPNPIIQGKKATTTVELKHPEGKALSPEECAGSFVTDQPVAGWPKKNTTSETPFRYNAKTKTCLYKGSSSSASTKSMSTIDINLTFIGNKFMNGTKISHRQTVILDPSKEQKPSGQTSTQTGSSTNANKKAKISSVKLTKDSANIVRVTAVVKNLATCGANPAGVSIEGFAYDKGSTKPKAIPNTKQPLARSPIEATSGAGNTCTLIATYTYPPGAKGMIIKHQLVIDLGGKKITKKSGKVTLGE